MNLDRICGSSNSALLLVINYQKAMAPAQSHCLIITYSGLSLDRDLGLSNELSNFLVLSLGQLIICQVLRPEREPNLILRELCLNSTGLVKTSAGPSRLQSLGTRTLAKWTGIPQSRRDSRRGR